MGTLPEDKGKTLSDGELAVLCDVLIGWPWSAI